MERVGYVYVWMRVVVSCVVQFRRVVAREKWKSFWMFCQSNRKHEKFLVSRCMACEAGMYHCLLFVLWRRVCLENKLNFRFLTTKKGTPLQTTKAFNLTANGVSHIFWGGRKWNKDICCRLSWCDVAVNLWEKKVTSISNWLGASFPCRFAALLLRRWEHTGCYETEWRWIKICWGMCCPLRMGQNFDCGFECDDE